MPAREGRGRLQRVLAVADEEIAQAEFAGIGFDRHTGIGLGLYSILFQLHKGDTRCSHASWFSLLTSRMKGDTAIALMAIRLSSPVR